MSTRRGPLSRSDLLAISHGLPVVWLASLGIFQLVYDYHLSVWELLYRWKLYREESGVIG